MKRMRKIFSLLIVMVMLGLSVNVFAEEHTVSTDSDSHTYQIYQIFTGTYDAASGQLQDLKYGTNAKTGTADESVSAADMAALAAIEDKLYANDQERIADLLPFVDLTGDPVAEIGKEKEASASLEEGYYIIKDTDVDPSAAPAHDPHRHAVNEVLAALDHGGWLWSEHHRYTGEASRSWTWLR